MCFVGRFRIAATACGAVHFTWDVSVGRGARGVMVWPDASRCCFRCALWPWNAFAARARGSGSLTTRCRVDAWRPGWVEQAMELVAGCKPSLTRPSAGDSTKWPSGTIPGTIPQRLADVHRCQHIQQLRPLCFSSAAVPVRHSISSWLFEHTCSAWARGVGADALLIATLPTTLSVRSGLQRHVLGHRHDLLRHVRHVRRRRVAPLLHPHDPHCPSWTKLLSCQRRHTTAAPRLWPAPLGRAQMLSTTRPLATSSR